MKRWHNWLLLGSVALLAAMAGYRLGVTGKGADMERAATLAIPDLSLSDLQGRPQSLGQWRGKVLVLNYWATWCQPCRKEMPGFSRLQERYGDKGVQFVGISIDDADKVNEFRKDIPVSYPLLVGDMSAMKSSADLGNTGQGLPFTAVFDRQGRLSLTRLGRLSETELEPELIELISR